MEFRRGKKIFTMLSTWSMAFWYNLPEIFIASWKVSMSCKSCGSVNQSKFTAEIGIHFPGQKNIDKPVAWMFPELVVCLDCGKAEFAVPEEELSFLANDAAAAAR
jgi:hypothetical protein